MNLMCLSLLAATCVLPTDVSRKDDPGGLRAEIAAMIEESVALDHDFYELFGSPRMQRIQHDPERFLPEVLEILRDPGESLMAKRLALLGMQCLPLDRRLDLMDDMLTMAEDGNLPVEVLRAMIVPGFEWDTSLAEHYTDEGARRALLKVRASACCGSGLARTIDDILSGDTWRWVSDRGIKARAKCGPEEDVETGKGRP